ncbi:hypothetical protein [Luedemannella helvata]|uniref:Restriction endonuclease type IV Mrr domain-containing protein n=1 Tax=Luedemannella helvata TaxID=349315 RepID=A0ABN2L9M4_9ACTN
MSQAVRWPDIGPDVFEDLCSVLISRLHPEARRIDGAGGDGGRDVQIATANGPEIFEMKSFTGRVTPVRKRQIERSLSRAAKHLPSAWRLVVPIDPTPAEERWFDSLAGQYSFPCAWYGRTWLDEKLAAHQDIVRYYLNSASDEIVQILRELSKESGALSRGVPDALDRMKVLAARLNGLDPHYSFGLSVDKDGTAAVTIWPKYAGAEHDRPIKVDTLFQFPDDNKGRAAAKAFKETLDYGTPITLSPEYVKRVAFHLPGGLSESFEGGEIRIGQSESLTADEFSAQLRIIDENGRSRAQIPLRGRPRNSGRRGAEVELADATGTIAARMRFDIETRQVNFQFTFKLPDGMLPAAMLPALQFMELYRPPNSVVVLLNDQEVSAPVRIDAPRDSSLEATLKLVKALDEIQRITGIYFPMPDELSSEELKDIFIARRLLAGETVMGTWDTMTITSTVGALSSLQASIARGANQLMAEAEMTLHIAGQDIPLGSTRRVMPNAFVVEWPEITSDDPDDPIDIKFRPGPDNTVSMSLIGDNVRVSKQRSEPQRITSS